MPRNDEREGEKEGPIVSGLLQISLCLKRHESMSDWGKPSGFRRRGTPHASRYAGKVCKCKIHAVPAPLHHWTMLSPRRNLCHALNMGNTNGMNSYVYGLLAMSQASSRLSLSQNYQQSPGNQARLFQSGKLGFADLAHKSCHSLWSYQTTRSGSPPPLIMLF